MNNDHDVVIIFTFIGQNDHSRVVCSYVTPQFIERVETTQYGIQAHRRIRRQRQWRFEI